MRLYPRYTVENDKDDGVYFVMDNVTEQQVGPDYTYFLVAQDKALYLESQVCEECGIEPRRPPTTKCTRCYVEGKL